MLFFLLNKYDYCQNCVRLILLMQSAACVYLLSSNFKFNRMRGWFTQRFFFSLPFFFFFFPSIRKPIWQETLMDFVRIAFDFNILIGLVCRGGCICAVMKSIEFDAGVHTFSRWSMGLCQSVVCWSGGWYVTGSRGSRDFANSNSLARWVRPRICWTDDLLLL